MHARIIHNRNPLWGQGIEAAGPADAPGIWRMLRNRRFDVPGGPIELISENQHTWKMTQLGRIVEMVSSGFSGVRKNRFDPNLIPLLVLQLPRRFAQLNVNAMVSEAGSDHANRHQPISFSSCRDRTGVVVNG